MFIMKNVKNKETFFIEKKINIQKLSFIIFIIFIILGISYYMYFLKK